MRLRGLGAFALALSSLGGHAASQSVLRIEADERASSLEGLRAQLSAGTRAIASDGVPRALRVEAHWPPRSPRAGALEAALTWAVSSELEAAGLASAQGAALVLELSADDRELRVTLTPREAEVSWWRSLFFAPPGSRRWRVALDAELRAFVDRRPRASRSSLQASSLALPERGYLAIGVAQPERDRPPVLIAVREHEVDILRLRVGRRPTLSRVARVERPPGPQPGVLARRPFATLLFEAGEVQIQWRDQTRRHVLRWAPIGLEARDAADCPALAHPWPDACAMPVDGRDYFASALVARRGHSAPPAATSSFYARWQGRVRRANGSLSSVEVLTNPRGRLVARTDRRELGLVGHGSALGVGDIDSDGSVEILASGGGEAVSADQLVLLRLLPDGGLRRLWSLEVPGAVRVAGSGDLSGDGVPGLFAIAETDSGATLWWLR